MHRVTPAAGLGWTVTEPGNATISLFNHDLHAVARMPMPLDAPQINVSATDRLVAAGDKHEIAVVDYSGAVQWRSSWSKIAGGATAGADFDLDDAGVLWVRLARRVHAGELVAIQASTGEAIHRISLPGPDAAWFVHRPADTWTGLALIDPGLWLAALVTVDAGRIVLQPLAGHGLAGFSPAGGRYLTMSFEGRLSVRELATDTVIVDRHLDDLPDKPATLTGRSDLDRAMFLTEELILTAVAATAPHGAVEEHLLLAARSLRYRSQLRYPHPYSPGAVHPAPTTGRWLTHHHKEDLLQLWQLSGHLDDEPPPGQLALL
jgi:hypothetical protein